jgi:hypothetical protein
VSAAATTATYSPSPSSADRRHAATQLQCRHLAIVALVQGLEQVVKDEGAYFKDARRC